MEHVRAHPLLDGVPGWGARVLRALVRGAPADPAIVVAETEHGSRFPSLMARDRIIGFQFAPRAVGADGLRLLGNMLALTGIAGRNPRLTTAGS